jgi:hypothetical protein
MTIDEKAVIIVSKAFHELVHAKQDAVVLYGATERHGVIEWAAEIRGDLFKWEERYVSIAVWEARPNSALGLRSTATVVDTVKDQKIIAEFPAEVSIEYGYDEWFRAVQEHLEQALMAITDEKFLAQLEEIGVVTRIQRNYDFVSTRRLTH